MFAMQPQDRFGIQRRASSESLFSAMKAVIDMTAWLGSLYVAAWVRLDFNFTAMPSQTFVLLLLIAAFCHAVVGFAIGLYRFRWMYGSFDEVAALAATTAVTTVVTFVAVSNLSPRPVPRSSTLAGGVCALVLMAGFRYLVRLQRERWRRPDSAHPDAVPTLIFGAGDGGQQIVKSMLKDREGRYIPVGFIDDDPAKKRLQMAGVKVLGGRSDLGEIALETGAKALLIAVPNAGAAVIEALTQLAEIEAPQLSVKVLPAVSELIDGTVGVQDIRDVSEVDLLGRHQIETDIEEIAHYIRGKRVLVTGAGGSIGSELCRQLHRYSPAELMMLDRDESALHSVQLSIEGRALLDSPNLLLGDLRDQTWMMKLFSDRRPEVVFHAAALKHLTLLEQYPGEAIKTNVVGTLNVLDASVRCGVERFVNISTDKAANPSSVLGYSKRVAERLTAHVARTTNGGTYLSVRFGNVLGSRGSFIHAFRAQIEMGGPVTVTDREVTRFFMTIPEAVQLVIQAGAIGGQAQALILDMGTPVRIADVAKRMIKQSKKDVKIIFTGLRPGEKLHEELLGDAETEGTTSHRLITSVEVPSLAPSIVESVDGLDTAEKQLAALVRWTTMSS
jgi:FlaA1/EpsC-like NDP-sugar epimerase